MFKTSFHEFITPRRFPSRLFYRLGHLAQEEMQASAEHNTAMCGAFFGAAFVFSATDEIRFCKSFYIGLRDRYHAYGPYTSRK
jgi:hypothetical protein